MAQHYDCNIKHLALKSFYPDLHNKCRNRPMVEQDTILIFQGTNAGGGVTIFKDRYSLGVN